MTVSLDTVLLSSPLCPLQVGLVYMFNLIVGTGALTMPRAFAEAGWVVSLALISFLGFMRCVLIYRKRLRGAQSRTRSPI